MQICWNFSGSRATFLLTTFLFMTPFLSIVTPLITLTLTPALTQIRALTLTLIQTEALALTLNLSC